MTDHDSPLQRLVLGFRVARQDPDQVVVEGFHAVKHALRFGAELRQVVTPDLEAALALARRLAPDVHEELARRLREVPAAWFRQLAPTPPRTGLIALAARPTHDAPSILAADPAAPILWLENPRDPGNLGAVVRVAASAGAGGVLVHGGRDPYDPVAVRGAAGLQFALPVAAAHALPSLDRPLLAADPDGEELRPDTLPDRCLVALGTERDGLSDPLLRRADRRIRIPMQPGVSSLNLATSAAVLLYCWRLRS